MSGEAERDKEQASFFLPLRRSLSQFLPYLVLSLSLSLLSLSVYDSKSLLKALCFLPSLSQEERKEAQKEFERRLEI